MSEISVIDIPEPPSSLSRRDHRNTPFDECYTGPAVDEYSWITEEDRTNEIELEKSDFVALIAVTNDLLSAHPEAKGDFDDRSIATEGAYLRRQLHAESGIFTYYFTEGDRQNGRHRSWCTKGDTINYCREEEYQEPSRSVLARLELAFPVIDESCQPRKFGKSIIELLAKIRR